MSYKHYPQPTAKERKALEQLKKEKGSSKMSKPAKVPVNKAKLRSAGASLRKTVNKQKK